MGKQSKVAKTTVSDIRLKIRAIVKKNPDLQARVDSIVASKRPQNKLAAAQAKRSAYSSVIRKNKLLSEAVKNIFRGMRG
jgi:hypothetical protein